MREASRHLFHDLRIFKCVGIHGMVKFAENFQFSLLGLGENSFPFT